MNNRGQSLVLFVIIIPIFLLILSLVYDVARIGLRKREMEDVSYIVIDYALDNLSSDNLKDNMEILLNKNIKVNKYDIEINDNNISIKLQDDANTVFPYLEKVIKINTLYKGFINDSGKKEIIKE